MLNVIQFTACLLAHLACVCLAKLRTTGRPRKFVSPAWFEIYWQNVVWSCTVRLCRYFASTLCGTFPLVCRGTGTLLFNVGRLIWAYRINVDVVAQRRTTALSVSYRRGHCCSSLDIFSRRVSSSWTLSFNADHQLDDFWEVREASSKAAGSYRLIWSRLLNADTPSEQFIALLVIVRRRSQLVPIHARRTWFVVNVRLTATLKSLPLARCWPACFALFSTFFPLVFRLTLTVVKLIVYILDIIIANYSRIVVWRFIAKISLLLFDILYILM